MVGDLNGSFGEATDALVEGDGDGGGFSGSKVGFVKRGADGNGSLGVDLEVVAGGAGGRGGRGVGGVGGVGGGGFLPPPGRPLFGVGFWWGGGRRLSGSAFL